VSFSEFFKLVTHPNLAQYDCRASKDKEEEKKCRRQ
jgi:hypothetical protein